MECGFIAILLIVSTGPITVIWPYNSTGLSRVNKPTLIGKCIETVHYATSLTFATSNRLLYEAHKTYNYLFGWEFGNLSECFSRPLPAYIVSYFSDVINH